MEVILDFVMAYLEFLTSKLEATAHPILDSIVHKACLLDRQQEASLPPCGRVLGSRNCMTYNDWYARCCDWQQLVNQMRGAQVTRRNLEQLRTIKTRMVRLFTKVETIRELLERLLDDDDDMRDMNLTAKCGVAFTSVQCALPFAQICSS